MSDPLRDRIAAVLRQALVKDYGRLGYQVEEFDCPYLADAVIAELQLGQLVMDTDDAMVAQIDVILAAVRRIHHHAKDGR